MYSKNWQDKLGLGGFFKDGRQTFDRCIQSLSILSAEDAKRVINLIDYPNASKQWLSKNSKNCT